jgi:hypothetical protein
MYTDAKMPKLIAEGLTMADAKDKCKENFKALSDKKRLKWIYKALEQEEAYIVSIGICCSHFWKVKICSFYV